MPPEFSEVTERSGDPVTKGQIADMHHRYAWAAESCRGRRVLEVACGTGQGLGLLAKVARSVAGSDIEPKSIRVARATYGDRFDLTVGSAEALPAADGSVDAVLIFEAIYYLPDVDAFLRECARVLSPGGLLFISSNNPDLFDFTPSPLSHAYYGAAELPRLLEANGFEPSLFGYARTGGLPLRHRVMRPLKAAASRFGLVPKTMRGKQVLRRILYGRLPEMPADLGLVDLPHTPPDPIVAGVPDTEHRFLYAMGQRVS
jgi:SAM-dependent methyltransferase